MNLETIISKLGFSQGITQDIILLLLVLFASFIFGIFIGRFKLITILVNTYISLALFSAVPNGFLDNYSYKLMFFFVCLVALTIFDRQLFEIHMSGAGSGFLWRVFALSFLEVALLLSITFSILPKSAALGYVSGQAYFYLASPNARFIWMVLPLVFIFIIHKKLNR